MEYRFALKKLRDIDFSKYAEYGREDVSVKAYEHDVSIRMWINEPRKVIWDNTAANRDAENVVIMTELEAPRFELEEARQMAVMPVEMARYWLACEARRMDDAGESGEFWVRQDEVKAWANATAVAIRVILRAAGLSDDLRLNRDAYCEALSNNSD